MTDSLDTLFTPLFDKFVQRILDALPTPAASTRPEPLLNTRDAARYLGVSKQYLDVHRVKGDGPRYVKLSQKCLYRQSDLDAWASERVRTRTG